MKRRIAAFLFLLSNFLILQACSTTPSEPAPVAAAAATPSTCPPPGTLVPFAKVMNPAFSSDYANCNVVTIVEYLNSNAPPAYGLERTHVLFVVTDPQAERLAGGNYVAARKALADIIFALKPGDRIQLRGGIYSDGMGTPITVPVFVATEVTKRK